MFQLTVCRPTTLMPVVSEASVTTRESLRWLPAEPVSDAEVLVLTVGKYFVDLRVFTSGPNAGKIDWSMGGVCLPLPATGVQGATRPLGSRFPNADQDWSAVDEAPLRFLNVIDQRLPAPSPHARLPATFVNFEESSQDLTTPTPDDVVFSPLASLPTTPGARFLESGKMPNPGSEDTETYVPFEEIWRELPLASGSEVVFLETVGGDGLGKAYTARFGPWAIGLMDDAGTYLAWRDDLVGGKWASIFSFGGAAAKAKVPRVEDVSGWSEGQVVELNGRSWVVRAVGQSA